MSQVARFFAATLARWTRARRRAFAVMAVLALLVPLIAVGATPAQAAKPASAVRAGFNSTVLERSDEGSSAAVPLGFSMIFFGKPFSNAYVNTNGNLTFDTALASYPPMTCRATGPI